MLYRRTSGSRRVQTAMMTALMGLSASASLQAATLVATNSTHDGIVNGPTYTVDELLVIGGPGGASLTLINGATASWEGGTIVGRGGLLPGDPLPGDPLPGDLQILGGSTVSNLGTGSATWEAITYERGTGYLGFAAGVTGTATVSGNGSSWVNSSTLYVGHMGTGQLTLSDGGYVSALITRIAYAVGSSGSVSITGSDSTLDTAYVFVGESGTGQLTLSGGASATVSSAFVGYLMPTATGTVNIGGPGSTWSISDDFMVGIVGSGEVNISDGGGLSTPYGLLGSIAGAAGNVNVTGQGSTWNSSGTIFVGSGGAGTLNITDGGSVTSTGGVIANAQSAVGSVTVSGTDSTWNINGNLSLTALANAATSIGSGTLTIKDGGKVVVSGTTLVMRNDNIINLQPGGTLQTQHLDFAFGGILNWTGGTLNVSGNVSSGLSVPEGGMLTGTATLNGDTVNAGTVAPGNSPGILTINGDYTQTSTGELAIELGGTSAGSEHDKLVISGDATLGGALSVQLIDGFELSAGQQFNILTVGGVLALQTFDGLGQDALVGTFDGVDLFIRYLYDDTPGVLLYTQPIHEPSSAALLALGAAMLLRRRRPGTSAG